MTEISDLRAALDKAQPLYFVPRDDIVNEVLVPAFSASSAVDCMMGFFSSHSLAEIAPGLATFIRDSNDPIRLVVSPFLSENDQNALKAGIATDEEASTKKVLAELPDADELARHTLSCLSWLIAQNRLQVKIAVMRDSLFHSKVWLFSDGISKAAFHGSPNMTMSGLRRNREQITLSRDWKGEEPLQHVALFEREFRELWSGGDEDCVVLDLPKAIEHEVMRHYDATTQPTEESCVRAWRKMQGLPIESPDEIEQIENEFSIPEYLNYESGDFAHQGQAVRAWCEAKWRGILEMATGSGKTITAMIGTYLLHQEVGKLLVVVSAPYRPLVAQWCGEIAEFGIRPQNLTLVSGASARDRAIKQAGRRLRRGVSDVEILVVSNATLCTHEFVESISSVLQEKLLISDECHNLGAEGFTDSPPNVFDYRLGLSATPVRQYDDEGTDALIRFFGEVCFQFTLEDAIGKCLTPYEYHVHIVHLNSDEMEEWYELTDKIAALAWKIRNRESDPYMDNLLRQRRLVLETANDKLAALENLLAKISNSDLQYTLIYATDKDPEQLDSVNQFLVNRGTMFHQLTYEETADRKRTAQILKSFQDGQLQVLTAKRVLDEGVNIPQIKCAYILASTTVKRQWVQRRGRILRKCDAIGKTHGVIHDFVTLPPEQGGQLDEDAKKVVQGELDRVWEFSHLCENGGDEDGPYQAVNHMQKLLTGE